MARITQGTVRSNVITFTTNFVNHSVWLQTPFGLSFMFNKTESQFYARNDTGKTINVHISSNFGATFGSASGGTTLHYVNLVPGATFPIAGSTAINFTHASDMECARMQFGTFDEMISGNYRDISATFIVGSSYMNNYIEIENMRPHKG